MSNLNVLHLVFLLHDVHYVLPSSDQTSTNNIYGVNDNG